jgi:SynChlorMet cassette protein ScmD
MLTNDRPIANSTIVLREEFDDWAILFDPDSGKAFGLNPTSVFIWKLLDGKHTIKDIVSEVKSSCEGVPEDVAGHVRDFLSQLSEHGFLGYETKE